MADSIVGGLPFLGPMRYLKARPAYSANSTKRRTVDEVGRENGDGTAAAISVRLRHPGGGGHDHFVADEPHQQAEEDSGCDSPVPSAGGDLIDGAGGATNEVVGYGRDLSLLRFSQLR